MKYILAFISLIAVFISCQEPEYKYTIKYVIYYPGYPDTVINQSYYPYYWSSDRDSNYIKIRTITGKNIYRGSAPFKILSYIKAPIKIPPK